MEDEFGSVNIQAVQDFRAARLKANVERIRSALQGKSADLLSYEDVREKLRVTETNQRQLKNIPLDSIVGSVGRYTDFTRRFFPRRETGEERWKRIRIQIESLGGLPPIEAYQLGEVYFVIDGNHRVSVAKSLEFPTIEGYVTRVEAEVDLSSDVDLDDLFIMERYAHFLKETQLKKNLPEVDLKMSAAGNYRVLERQIEIHRQWMGEDISCADAALDWYKTVYCPIIQIIRDRGMLRDFPKRTETDLYVWIEKHRHELAKNIGWPLEADTAAIDLSQKPKSLLQRVQEKLRKAIIPSTLNEGPMPGEWRKTWLSTHQKMALFRHILVAISAEQEGWAALKQAIHIAQNEQSQVHGLHITNQKTELSEHQRKQIQTNFDMVCEDAGVRTGLRFKQGNITQTLINEARWVDLVVVSLKYPPGPQIIHRLTSGISQLIRSCPRPILAVPYGTKPFTRVLLAYDDSPGSREALYIATHISKTWRMPLTVVSVEAEKDDVDILSYARSYLADVKVHAKYVEKQGETAPQILQVARDNACDLIIMGSYGHNPILEVAFGSTVNVVLRNFDGAVLICR